MEPDNNTEIGNYDGARPPQTGGGKLNWPILLGAAILLAAAAGTYAFRNNWLHKYNRQLVPIGGLKAPSPSPTTNWAALDITPQPTPSPKPISPNAWEIKIPGQEIKATTSLAKYILAYGVKENRKTTVYKRNVRTGNESKAFDFDEYLKAENSGNSWAEMPPNIALALDNRQLAFVDAGGLKTYDMQTGSIKAFLYILPTPMGATIGPNALDWNEKNWKIYIHYPNLHGQQTADMFHS